MFFLEQVGSSIEYIYYLFGMIGSNRPPMRHKKGIGLVQSPAVSRNGGTEGLSSGMGSTQSVSRTRGISISRETGINIDKIYDSKHFLPPKAQQQPNKSIPGSVNTLNTVKSLKLISVFAESMVDTPSRTEKNIRQQEVPVSEGMLNGRCNSPILKLGNTSGRESAESQKGQIIKNKPNLMKF